MKQRFDSEAQKRLLTAIQDIERRSSAEVVLEIHARAGSYGHAHARFGALLALLSLIAIVFSPVTFPPYAVIVDAVAFYGLGVWLARRSNALRRLVTSDEERRKAFQLRASSLFHERGIANTSAETGVLVFAAELERRIDVLPDRGVLKCVQPEAWNAAIAQIHAIRTIDGDSVLHVLHLLDPILSTCMPAKADDRDELANAPGYRFE